MNEEINFKPTLKDPVNNQSKGLEKGFKKTMTKFNPGMKINETDTLLSEMEFSLKKKIFSLPKMEALVFSDPKLTTVYDGMSEEGEEKYGYHYNETIMNMIFNDYILNSPKYLQKYRMAIPKEKKRRDKSGINQLRKAGEKTMKNPTFKVKEPTKAELAENDKMISGGLYPVKVMFLVNEKEPGNPDLFAYFPEEDYDHSGKFKNGYSHIGQHSAVSPEYAAESRLATPEEYADLKAELENIGYNVEVYDQHPTYKGTNETTGAASSGAYSGPAAWKKGGDLMENEPDEEETDQPQDDDCFIESNGFKYSVSCGDKFQGEFVEMNIALAKVKEWKQKNNFYPNTWFVSDHGNISLIDDEGNILKETSTTGSVGGAGMGSGGYSTPYAWGSGDLMKGKKGKVMRKPIWPGGTLIQETNYLTETAGFEKYVQALNEDITSIEANILNQEKSKTKPFVNIETLPNDGDRDDINNTIIDKTAAFTSDAVKGWGNADANIQMDTLATGQPDKPNLNLMEEQTQQPLQKITTPEELKAYVTQKKAQGGKGLIKEDVPLLAGQALFNVAIKMANSMMPVHWDDLADTNSMWSFIKQDGGMTFESLKAAVTRACKQRMKNDGTGFDKLFEQDDLAEPVVGTQTFNRGDMVFDKEHNSYGTVLDNYGDEINGDHGDIRLDSDGNVNIYTYDQTDWHTTGYNLIKIKDPIQAMNDTKPVEEDTQTMVQANPMTMANKTQPLGDQSANMDTGARSSGGGMNESHEKLFEEMNEELEAYSIHHNKLMKMSEDRKPSALVLKDRLGSENVKNFKSDLQQSGTKEIIDVEKELQYKDQQTNVGDDPQKLGLDIEKKEIVNTDAEGDEFLKNAGDSDNDNGDEIPKRNMTTKEQHEVDMMRQGQQDLVFDNEPSKRFEDRMKADMGDTLYKIRQEKMKYRAKAPMYNKDPQPTEVGADKSVQFDKNQSGWNEREGLMETMVTGRFVDDLGKKFIKDFRLNEAKELKTPSNTARQTGLFELDFTGFGNKYKNKATDDYKVNINEGVEAVLTENKYYTNGIDVFFIKNPLQKLNETEQKAEKPKINEQVDKMKHLLGYKPNEFVSTKNVKNNRGF